MYVCRRYFILWHTLAVDYYEKTTDPYSPNKIRDGRGMWMLGGGQPKGAMQLNVATKVDVLPVDPTEPESKFGFYVRACSRLQCMYVCYHSFNPANFAAIIMVHIPSSLLT